MQKHMPLSLPEIENELLTLHRTLLLETNAPPSDALLVWLRVHDDGSWGVLWSAEDVHATQVSSNAIRLPAYASMRTVLRLAKKMVSKYNATINN